MKLSKILAAATHPGVTPETVLQEAQELGLEVENDLPSWGSVTPGTSLIFGSGPIPSVTLPAVDLPLSGVTLPALTLTPPPSLDESYFMKKAAAEARGWVPDEALRKAAQEWNDAHPVPKELSPTAKEVLAYFQSRGVGK